MAARIDEKQLQSVPALLDRIAAQFCNEYCKWPHMYGENECKMYDERCAKCPVKYLS